MKKKRKVKKYKVIPRQKQRMAAHKRLIVLCKELKHLAPKAVKLSIAHLAIAIYHKWQYYVTADEYLLKKVKRIKKNYNIQLCKSIYEVNEYERAKSGCGTPFNFYV